MQTIPKGCKVRVFFIDIDKVEEGTYTQAMLNLPLYLHKKGFYYGYFILFAGTLGVAMSVPGQTMGISVYTNFLIDELGVTRVQLSLMYMLGTLSSAFILPFAGRILDKKGSRFLSVIATSGLALFLYLISLSPSLSTSLSSSLNIDKISIVLPLIFVCFLGVRHFGQGQLTMASRTMMAKWFEKKRGLLLGISGTFSAFAFGAAPLALHALIESYTWKGSLQVLSFILLMMSVFCFLFFRRSPEHCGLQIDGGLVGEDPDNKDFKQLKNSFSAAEVKKTFIFWAFNLAVTCQAFIITAITFHMSDIAEYFKISSSHAYSVFLPVSVIATCSELFSGYLSDKVPLKYLQCTMQAALIFALFGLTQFHTHIGYTIVAIGLGVSGGIFSLITAAAWPKLFGRLHLGAISGVVTAWMVAGSALGPYLFSLLKDITGTYQSIFYISMLIPLSILIMGSLTSKENPVDLRVNSPD